MNMMDVLTLIIFIAMLIWVAYDFYKCRKLVYIFSKNKNRTVNIMFGILIALAITTLIFNFNAVNILRTVVLAAIIILYVNFGDGVGKGGVFAQNRAITCDEIMAYDYDEMDGNFNVYISFITNSNLKKGKPIIETASVSFDMDKKDEIIDCLAQAMPKKHKRVKK